MSKQRYFKRENKKIKKDHLKEITGLRTELEPLVGQIIDCEVFVTNSIGFNGDKRLLTEIRIPQTDYFIKHLWVKSYNLPMNKVPSGYRNLKLKVTQYKSQINDGIKYGVKIADERIKPRPAKLIIPKWKKDQDQDHRSDDLDITVKPYKKMRIVKKGSE